MCQMLERMLLNSLLASTVTAVTCVNYPATANERTESAQLVAQACTQCHDLSPITLKRDGAIGWRETVEEMVLRGAQLNSEQVGLVAAYLTQNFGPGSVPMRTAKPNHISEVDGYPLPSGAGADLVKARCQLCHDLGRITSVAAQVGDWHDYVVNMTRRSGIPISDKELATITDYLNANF